VWSAPSALNVRVWHEREPEKEIAEFKTTVMRLLTLRDWLEALRRLKRAAMGATGGHCNPCWAVQEDRVEGLERSLPGRAARHESLIETLGAVVCVVWFAEHGNSLSESLSALRSRRSSSSCSLVSGCVSSMIGTRRLLLTRRPLPSSTPRG
jgi:hypothetical protein